MAHRSVGKGLLAAAFLVVHAQAQQVCVSPPSGLLSWWDGDAVSETTVFDTRGSNNGILASCTTGTTQGYVQARTTSGNNPFIAYGVGNDGGTPGARSDDGAFVPAQ